tara:strand:- start:2863 stop:3369 length:507 start_codon:yes stop_codon:yes gene_type:complete
MKIEAITFLVFNAPAGCMCLIYDWFAAEIILMKLTPTGRMICVTSALLITAGMLATTTFANAKFVSLPIIEKGSIAPRVIYLENPRFPKASADDLQKVMDAAGTLVEEHFSIKVETPRRIPVRHIDEAFSGLVGYARRGFKAKIGDFRSAAVNWNTIRKLLVEKIQKQ